jgi:hypothetical protein
VGVPEVVDAGCAGGDSTRTSCPSFAVRTERLAGSQGPAGAGQRGRGVQVALAGGGGRTVPVLNPWTDSDPE